MVLNSYFKLNISINYYFILKYKVLANNKGF